MAGIRQRIVQYYNETVQEVKKSTWPSRQELIESTGMVIGAFLLFSLFVYVVDTVLRLFVHFVVSGSFS